ncbi:MAG: deoxyribonuclease IV [Kiritimatiellia bacterium]
MSKQPHKTAPVPLIGAHFSTAGGLHHALEEAVRLDCPVAQLFTASPRQWKARPLGEPAVELFLKTQQRSGVRTVSHAAYLINLAGEDAAATQSLAAFTEELRRCQALRIPHLVVHPGSAGEQTVEQAVRRIAQSLDAALAASENSATTVLLETTAGQGHSIGRSFGELAAILEHCKHQARLGICLDTCHIFAAGYDIRTEETYHATIDAFQKALPLKRLQFFHFNDSVTGLNSHVDRHAHLGEGELGIKPFGFILNDPRFLSVGKCLETENDEKRARDFQILRDAFTATSPPSQT